MLKELAARSEKERVLGMAIKGQKKYFLLALKDDKTIDQAEPGIVPSLKALDVNLLHIPILKKRLNIGAQDLAASKKVTYVKDPAEAAAAVQSGEGKIAFFSIPPEPIRCGTYPWPEKPCRPNPRSFTRSS